MQSVTKGTAKTCEWAPLANEAEFCNTFASRADIGSLPSGGVRQVYVQKALQALGTQDIKLCGCRVNTSPPRADIGI